MPNIDIVGQVPVEIDHKAAITITNFSVREATPTNPKNGAFGPIGLAQGIPVVTGDFTICAPKTGLELNLDLLKVKPGGWTLTYTMGVQRWAVVGGKISERGVTVDDGQGNVEVRVSFAATEHLRIA